MDPTLYSQRMTQQEEW